MSSPPTSSQGELSSPMRLRRHSIYNLLGEGVPLVVAVVAVPLLVGALGNERFGLLMLAVVIIIYFSLIDMGLGRALTQMVARKLADGARQQVPAVVCTAMAMLMGLGTIGAAVMGALSFWLVDWLGVHADIRHEALTAFLIMALALPPAVGSLGLRGVLEAYGRFDLSNAVRLPLGVFTFAGPLLVLPFSHRLEPVIAVMVVGRYLGMGAFAVMAWVVIADLRSGMSIRRDLVGPLLSFGGWLTVTNVVGPLMMWLDRFLIGRQMGMEEVAFYTVPYEVVTKLLLIPAALAGVLFPAFTRYFGSDRAATTVLFIKGVRSVCLLLFPALLLAVVFAESGLRQWVGGELADQGTVVVPWLAVGVLINAVAFVPLALIHGAARPDLAAKLHLIELPIYLLAVWWMIGQWGIAGAAAAWTGRVTLDAMVLMVMSRRVLARPLPGAAITALLVAVAIGVLVIGAVIPDQLVLKLGFVVVVTALFAPLAWRAAFGAAKGSLLPIGQQELEP